MSKGKILLWIIAVTFSLTCQSAERLVYEKPISLQIESLTRWRNSSEALAIQQGLSAMLKPRRNYPRIAEPFVLSKQYIPLYGKPFLTLDTELNDFGGFFALVVFKDYPKVFRLWLYEIDKNVFEIREMIPLQVTLNKVIMDELKDKRISPFWLTAIRK